MKLNDPQTHDPDELVKIGWREWGKLPKLDVGRIKVKVDTGARTSALHVSNVKIRRRGRKATVYFDVHPKQHSAAKTVRCSAKLVGHRAVKSSSGHLTIRPVIKTIIALDEYCWESEVTLVNRDLMGFRMLLGREAIRNRFLVHSGRSYVLTSIKKQKAL